MSPTSPLITELSQELRQIEERGRLRSVIAAEPLGGTLCDQRGRSLVNFTSWDYLALARHPGILKVTVEALSHYGVGSGATAATTGVSLAHQRCEARVAQFFVQESALLFPTKNQAMLTATTALLEAGDCLLLDENSQSVAPDGAELVGAAVITFQQLSPPTFSQALERARAYRRRIALVETLSPLSGGVTPLPVLFQTARNNDTEIILDESFAFGALGIRGAGIGEECVHLFSPLATIVDFARAGVSACAAVVGSATLLGYLFQRSRALQSEVALPSSVAASALEALNLIELSTAARSELHERAGRLVQGLVTLGFLAEGSDRPGTPIVAVRCRNFAAAQSWQQLLLQRGYLAEALPPFKTRSEESVLRFLVRVDHTPIQIDGLLQNLAELKVLKRELPN